MNGIDCATKLTAASVQALKSAGIEVVGRYLGYTLWNGLSITEVNDIRNAGLKLFLIFELSPTKASYFSYDKGVSDAKQAIREAGYLNAPTGITIFFAVDYDAQAEDMASIKDYFHGVHDGLQAKFYTGAYGSFDVIEALKGASYPPDKYYQTYAWSGGQKSNCHIYQYSNDVTLAGVALDKDYVNEDAGLWGQETVPNNNQEEEETLDVAVLLNTKEDYWAGADVAAKNGNCAVFVRGSDKSIPVDAMKAKKLIVVGGATTGHANEVLLSGNTKYDTADAVKKYLG